MIIMDILKNKQYKKYDRFSRYSNFPIYYNTLDKKYEYGTTANLDDTTAYTYYIVKPDDTYDSIALACYKNPTYYWLICDYNRIIDCFSTPLPGTKLKIPVLSKIEYL